MRLKSESHVSTVSKGQRAKDNARVTTGIITPQVGSGIELLEYKGLFSQVSQRHLLIDRIQSYHRHSDSACCSPLHRARFRNVIYIEDHHPIADWTVRFIHGNEDKQSSPDR